MSMAPSIQEHGGAVMAGRSCAGRKAVLVSFSLRSTVLGATSRTS